MTNKAKSLKVFHFRGVILLQLFISKIKNFLGLKYNFQNVDFLAISFCTAVPMHESIQFTWYPQLLKLITHQPASATTVTFASFL